jgi:hypothetical protein
VIPFTPGGPGMLNDGSAKGMAHPMSLQSRKMCSEFVSAKLMEWKKHD